METETNIEGSLAILPPELSGILTAGVEIHRMGATFHEDTPQETVEYVMRRAAELGRSSDFVIGDAMNHEAGRGREDFGRWSGITGRDEKDLRNVARVTRKIALNTRRDQFELDFCRPLAALPALDQEHALNVAEEKGLDKRQLRKFLHTGDADKAKSAPPVDSGADNIAPHAGRILALVNKLESGGMIGEASREQLLALHADFMPLFRAHARVVRVLMKRGDGDAIRKVQSDLVSASKPV